MQKILLISPSFPISRKLFSPKNWFPPLGITTLSSILKKNNFEVDILDSLLVYLKFPEIDLIDFEYATEKFISNKEYDFVGISVLSLTRIIALKISKKIKAQSPKAIIIWGGPHASIMYEQIISNYSDVVDGIVIGEGENQIIEAINHFNHFLSNSSINKISLFHSIRSLNIISDNYPFPDYTSYSNYSFKIKNISIIGSRGCPFNNCDYCSSNWIPFRKRSTDSIVREIDFLKNKYNIEKVHFHDNTFTYNKNRTLKLFNDIYNKSLFLNYAMKTRFDSVDEDIISLFSKIGGKTISFGLESGNQDLRKKMGKDISNSRIKYLTNIIKDHGLSFCVYILFGHPEETDDDINKTIDFLHEIEPNEVVPSIICLYPGTALYNKAVDEGKINENDWLTNKIYFTYVDEERKHELIHYVNLVNDMFPRFIEWTEYSGLYNIQDD